MSKKGNRILETFGEVIPVLTEVEKEKLLSYREGYADAIRNRKNLSIVYADSQQDVAV